MGCYECINSTSIGGLMTEKKLPDHYVRMREKFDPLFKAYEELGKRAREQGPLDEKTTLLIQLAASAAIHSEGSVHSHTRRALQAGVATDEIYHAIVLLTTTIGWPTVAAALSWVEDVLDKTAL